MMKHVVIAAAAVLAAVPASAQVSLNSRALGMGGAYIGVARGQESLHLNPANLGLPNSPHWSAAIPQLAFGVQTIGVEPGDLWDLREYGEMEPAERDAFLAKIPASGTGGEIDVRAPIFSLQVGRFAVGAGYALVGEHTVNRSIVDLVLTGFEQSKLAQYNIDNTDGFRAAFFDIHAAYGRRIGPLALGATGHYYIPREMVRSAFVQQDVVTNTAGIPTDIEVTYQGVRAEGGSGFGVDVGAAMQPIPGLTLGVALDNAFNSLEWNEDLRLNTVTLNREDYESGDAETILSRYDESEQDYADAGADPQTRALAQQILEERGQGLPMTLRVGGAFALPTSTTVGVQYQSQLEDSPISGMWENQVSVGVQQKLPIITLRAGLATDMADANMLTGGLTLGPIQLGVARLTGAGERNGWVYTFALSGRSDTTMP
ncbi:DUF5723 family protein [Longimicrobium sp.]|uniref:DUF5723 family protein n=1 Tax=Longimicrobium sp. TaxID=2029185 RepID=UPI002F941CF4